MSEARKRYWAAKKRSKNDTQFFLEP